MSYNVMLVDDDYVTNLVNSTIFEQLDSVGQVSSFTNPALALQYIRSRCVRGTATHPLEPLPDLLLVDLRMVPIDGFDFIAELKRCVGEAFQRICVSVLTISHHPQDQRLASELHLSTYLSKPLTEQKAKQLLAISDVMKAHVPFP